MNASETRKAADEQAIPRLVAEVYDAAPPPERARLLETLLQPLGLLSLVSVANGIFARARLRGGCEKLHVRVEDIQNVGAADVAALVRHAEQISAEIVDGLAQTLTASPILAGTAVGAVLLSMLVRRIRLRAGRSDVT
jgi:hypothetical protein